LSQCHIGDPDLILLQFLVDGEECVNIHYGELSITLTINIYLQQSVVIPLAVAICCCSSSYSAASFLVTHADNSAIFAILSRVLSMCALHHDRSKSFNSLQPNLRAFGLRGHNLSSGCSLSFWLKQDLHTVRIGKQFFCYDF
jgi:hypothetical protein